MGKYTSWILIRPKRPGVPRMKRERSEYCPFQRARFLIRYPLWKDTYSIRDDPAPCSGRKAEYGPCARISGGNDPPRRYVARHSQQGSRRDRHAPCGEDNISSAARCRAAEVRHPGTRDLFEL